jgi:hypothetical protein
MLGEITERHFDATFDLNRGPLACRYRDDLLDGRVVIAVVSVEPFVLSTKPQILASANA